MASNPIATAGRAVEQDAASQPAAQATGAGAKTEQSNTVQDTVTLSSGIPQQTTAEEAGLFRITAPTLNSAPAQGSLNRANQNPENLVAPNAGVADLAEPGPTPKTAVVPVRAAHAESRVAAAGAGGAAVAAATAPTAASATNSAQAPAAAPASPTASAGSAQAATTATSQSQNLLQQFTEYLQELGLSPQAVNQMLQAAQILNNLDPPAMQQAIGELRAQATSLAVKATDAPLSTAPTVRAGVSPTVTGASTEQGTIAAASGSASK